LSPESFRAARIGTILVMIAIAALILWFFFARVTLYQNSSSFSLTENGRLQVTFPKETMAQIRPGQAAILRLRLDPNQKPVGIPAVVFSTDQQKNQAEILLVSDELPVDLSPGNLQGVLSVEVAYVTPVSLVLNATGNRAIQREIPVSPQSIEE
jgi:hypothetical protein